MKFYGQSQAVIESIIERFKKGDVPDVMAQIFVERNDDIPSAKWSFGNRFIQAMMGSSDSRGFRQWQTAGRKVSKGARAIYILGPITKKIEDRETEEEKMIVLGFKSIPVFKVEDTEITDAEKWEKQGGIDINEESRLKALPFRDVADEWGIDVNSYTWNQFLPLGYYKWTPDWSGAIALGTKNLSTWAHELIHAADRKAGNLNPQKGNKAEDEIVAELGGAALLKIGGYHVDADLGGAWEYILRYSDKDEDRAIRSCLGLISRIGEAIDTILNTAAEIEQGQSIAA